MAFAAKPSSTANPQDQFALRQTNSGKSTGESGVIKKFKTTLAAAGAIGIISVSAFMGGRSEQKLSDRYTFVRYPNGSINVLEYGIQAIGPSIINYDLTPKLKIYAKADPTGKVIVEHMLRHSEKHPEPRLVYDKHAILKSEVYVPIRVLSVQNEELWRTNANDSKEFQSADKLVKRLQAITAKTDPVESNKDFQVWGRYIPSRISLRN